MKCADCFNGINQEKKAITSHENLGDREENVGKIY